MLTVSFMWQRHVSACLPTFGLQSSVTMIAFADLAAHAVSSAVTVSLSGGVPSSRRPSCAFRSSTVFIGGSWVDGRERAEDLVLQIEGRRL